MDHLLLITCVTLVVTIGAVLTVNAEVDLKVPLANTSLSDDELSAEDSLGLEAVLQYSQPTSEVLMLSCTNNDNCPSNTACIRKYCANPCENYCGPSATCQVCYHNPVCRCSPGYEGDPLVGCKPEAPDPNAPKCTKDEDCKNDEVCANNECENPCENHCGANAVCKVVDRKPRCYCKPDYTGCPLSGCISIKPECTASPECPLELACVNNKCVDPCLMNHCGSNTICQVCDHVPICRCNRGYKGDPKVGCEPDTDDGGTKCLRNEDCKMDEACIRHKCQNPCDGWCGPNTRCDVINRRPLCTCIPGYHGCPAAGCVPEDLPPTKVPPCGGNSSVPCSCEPGYTGDPTTGCAPIKTPCCKGNNECPSHLACIECDCKDPCNTIRCGSKTECKGIGHVPSCMCSPGYTGNPDVGCTPIPTPDKGECTSNMQCPPNLSCVNKKCVRPCPGPCGRVPPCSLPWPLWYRAPCAWSPAIPCSSGILSPCAARLTPGIPRPPSSPDLLGLWGSGSLMLRGLVSPWIPIGPGYFI